MKKDAKHRPPKNCTLGMGYESAKRMKALEAKIAEEAKSRPILRPNQKHIKKAIKLWAMAVAAENNSPAPKLSNARLDKETTLAAVNIPKKYGKAFSDEIRNCQFDDFISNVIRNAAKRLLIAPKETFKEK